LTHRGVERAHVPPGRIEVLDHARAHQLDIAATRGGQQALCAATLVSPSFCAAGRLA